MKSSDHRGLPNFIFLYILISIAGVTYVILNISYTNKVAEFTHQGYSLIHANQTVAVEQGGQIVEVSVTANNSNSTSNSTISSSSSERYKFIVFIITAPDHADHRAVLREKSWAGYNWKGKNGRPVEGWKYMFVVGRSESQKLMSRLEKEAEIYKDLIIADNLDSYHNLVLKVLWILDHSLHNYDYDYLIKADDDTFINIQLLNEYVSRLKYKKLFYGGVKVVQSQVFRKGRYGVSKELWEPDVYSPYCSGSGYILGSDSVREMLRVYNTGVQPVFFVEDAYMGALAYHSGIIKPEHINGFYWHQKYGCSDKNALLMHYVKLEMLENFMNRYIQGKSYC